uniref:Uncharacterized protein n=2 Tax=Cajanus cajan TaxID=3821 RepID=A0A151S8U3_CAJCA|nr:hypothetical protein KK1_026914 [Cajanus cajan]
MACPTIKILSLILFLILISQGYSKCTPNDISVTQIRTGLMVQGKSEWSVAITNKCQCPQHNVNLNCSGFHSIEPIDPQILTVSLTDDFCIVTPAQPISKNVVSFKYAWDHQFPLNPISSQSSCS